jgi:transposase
MTIKSLSQRGVSQREIARLLDVTEGTVRYHARCRADPAPDGRAKPFLAASYAEAIAFWRSLQDPDRLNLADLHDWLVAEHSYPGSLRSLQRYWKATYPAPRIHARRRVETPPGAQIQADWADFPSVIVGGERIYLRAFRMVLGDGRRDAVVWSVQKDMLAWLSRHTEALRRLGGVAATVRVDNEKTAVSRGAGAWGEVNATYRRYAQLMRFHVDACPPRTPRNKGKIERSVRTQRWGADPSRYGWRDDESEKSARRRRCPATGTTVLEASHEERRVLTPLPEPVWEPFDLVQTRQVTVDGLVSFEGRQYNVPFHYVLTWVEVRGCARTVQVVADAAIMAVHPRHTAERLVINPAYYDGPSTERVVAPPSLGKLGRRMMELACESVQHRSIDYYHALMEVAR